MGANTKIPWCHHTFNPWWGCTDVSSGCRACYARALAKRCGFPDLWGKDVGRRFFGEAHWRELINWNAAAGMAGERRRVFCGSMCDVMEDRPDVESPRQALWCFVDQTPNLDWLLLTKRPENFPRFLPDLWRDHPRPNVWLLATVENYNYIRRRIADLLRVPAVVHGISMEPLLGPVDIGDYLGHHLGCDGDEYPCAMCGSQGRLGWVAIGGESGHGARPFDIGWARGLIAQCRLASVACFLKQLGASPFENGKPLSLRDRKGADPAEWPEDLRVRQLPEVPRFASCEVIPRQEVG